MGIAAWRSATAFAYYQVTPNSAALEAFRDYIMAETLAVDFDAGESPLGWYRLEDSIDEEALQVAIERINAD